MFLSREDIANFDVLARVWVEGRRFSADRGIYVVVRPLALLPAAFLAPEWGYADSWSPQGSDAPHGSFTFPRFSCPALTAEGQWAGHDGGWRRWDHAEMLLTQYGLRFAETGWPSGPYQG